MANINQWKVGDIISASKLNEMVTAINSLLQQEIPGIDTSNLITTEQLTTILQGYSDVGHTHNISEIVDLVLPTVPTKLSQLENDSNFISSIPEEYVTEQELNAKGFATETFVTNKIAEASIGGGEGSAVDLSGLGADLSLNGQTLKLKNSNGVEIGTGVTLPQASGGEVVASQVEPFDDDMPKVFFNGDKPTNKTDVYATIEYISKTEHFKGYVAIKCQGTSSMAYPKKNYTIKMFTDEARTTKLKKDFKGWGKQSKFCLKANYIDHSHARNICSAKLWNEIVASRSNYQELPELLRTSPMNGAIDGFPIKVYYNNSYEGVYTWNIPKDAWMFNMDDTLDNHCVLCGEEYVSGCFRVADASVWSDEVHDVMPESIKTSFNNFITFVINSSDDEFKANLNNYVYVDSLIDYYIFQYAICGLDSMGKNQLFATYDGTKWIATSYDMDSTFGLYWNGGSFVSAKYRMQADYESGKNTSSNYNGEGNLLYVRLEQLFPNEIKARYQELRNTVLSYTNVVNTFERFMDIIGKDLYAEDGTIYTGIPSQATNNIQQIRNYYRDRLTYVDGKIAELRVRVPCTAISLSANTLSLTNDNKTATLVATVTPSETTDAIVWSVTPTGICTVKNGVVAAKANGDCTITVTCGQQSATCTVNVSGIVETPVEENVIFALSEPIVGDGTASTPYVDTNIKLFSNEYIGTDWTILTVVDLQSSAQGNVIAHCMRESGGYPGMSIDMQPNNNLRAVLPNNVNTIIYPAGFDSIKCIAITKQGNTFKVYKQTGEIVNEFTTATITNIDNTLVIGAYKSTEGTYGRYLSGTIHDFRLLSTVYTVDEIKAYCDEKLLEFSNTLRLDSMVYELNERTVLDGSSQYINTRIPLLESPIDFTILMDFAMNASSTSQQTLVHCMKEVGPYPGINLQIVTGGRFELSGQNLSPVIVSSSEGTMLLSSTTTENQPFAIRKTGSTIELISKNGKGSSTYNYNSTDKKLLLGAYPTNEGIIGGYANVTINKAQVWTKALTDEEIQSWINS